MGLGVANGVVKFSIEFQLSEHLLAKGVWIIEVGL